MITVMHPVFCGYCGLKLRPDFIRTFGMDGSTDALTSTLYCPSCKAVWAYIHQLGGWIDYTLLTARTSAAVASATLA